MNGRAEGTMLFIGLYAFFLFGLVFDDPLIAEVHPVPTYLTVLLFGGLLVLCAFRAAPTPSAPGAALLMLILIGLTAADSLHVRGEITEIAPEFAHARFSVLFIPFALSASLAVTR